MESWHHLSFTYVPVTNNIKDKIEGKVRALRDVGFIRKRQQVLNIMNCHLRLALLIVISITIENKFVLSFFSTVWKINK